MIHESVLWAAAADAASRIERTLSEVKQALAHAGINAALVEGSALSAELSSSDELVRRFASRASLSLAAAQIDRAEQVLCSAGWRRDAAQGDLHLLRTAARHGRHLVFALLDDEEDGALRQSLHPAHPDAVRLRNERLSRWRTSVRLTLTRHRSHVDEIGRTVTETFELSIVESASARAADTVPP